VQRQALGRVGESGDGPFPYGHQESQHTPPGEEERLRGKEIKRTGNKNKEQEFVPIMGGGGGQLPLKGRAENGPSEEISRQGMGRK